MGNSHYWTSLWVVVLFICLGVICIFGFAAVMSFFYERLNGLGLWQSPFWVRYKTPIIVGCVILGIAALIAFIHYQGVREEKAAREYAEEQGWGFAKDVPQELSDRVEEIVSYLDIRLHFMRLVENRNRHIWIFDCQYTSKNAGRKSDQFGTVCLVQSHRFHPIPVPVAIDLRDWTEIMGSDKVDMGKTPFTEKFIVTASDAAVARDTVNDSLQAVMLQYLADEDSGRLSVTLGNRGAVLMTGRITDQTELQNLLKWARSIEEAAD